MSDDEKDEDGMTEIRLLPALNPNCTNKGQPENAVTAHDWREIGSDAVQSYDCCTRCGRTEASADHPWRENTIDPIALSLIRGMDAPVDVAATTQADQPSS